MICKMCGIDKDENNFPNYGGRGIRKRKKKCKDCSAIKISEWKITINGIRNMLWRSMNTRTVNGSGAKTATLQCRRYIDKGVELRMTKDEFYGWFDKNRDRCEQILKDGERPTIDRIDKHIKHYQIDNIRFETLRNQRIEGAKSNGEISKKAVIAVKKDGSEILKFKSAREAERSGFLSSCISVCCNGKMKSHKGYNWKFDLEGESL